MAGFNFEEFKLAFMSLARSFIFSMDDDTLSNIVFDNTFFENDIYKSLRRMKEEDKKKEETLKKSPKTTDTILSLDDTDGLF